MISPSFPCILCAQPAPAADGICPACLTGMPRLPTAQCRCGIPLPAAGEQDSTAELPPLCGRCLDHPPPFGRVVCGYAWRFPLDQLIARYKYRGRLHLERPLLALWRQTLPPQPGELPDALVPVPLHWRRRWWRGFNQSQRLANGLATTLGIPLLPALVRQRATAHQQGLRQSRRRRNLRRAFRVVKPVSGLHLALLDDVVTTGSTARETAGMLLDAGAARVDIWAIARVMPGVGQD